MQPLFYFKLNYAYEQRTTILFVVLLFNPQ